MLCGGFNCNGVFDYLDFDAIKQNPKIICGYSDPTSLINIIYAKTGLVTFHGPNFKSLSAIETDYGNKEVQKRLFENSLKIGENDEYKTIQEGEAEGILVGGNLSLLSNLINRKISNRYKKQNTIYRRPRLRKPSAE